MLVDVAERTLLMAIVGYFVYCISSSISKWDPERWTPYALIFPISILYNQGIYLIDTHQVYLSESYAPLDLLHYGRIADKGDSIAKNTEGRKGHAGNSNSEDVSELRSDVYLYRNDDDDVQAKCSSGFLSPKVISSDKLKEKLQEVEQEYSKTGYQLSISIDRVANYYMTKGLVLGCEIVNLEVVGSQNTLLIRLGIPLVRIETEFQFKRIVGLHFQNSFENSLCSGVNNQTEYILIKNKTIIPIPSTKHSDNTVSAMYFDKCRIGPELHTSQTFYYTLCHLDLDSEGLSSVKMAIVPNYFSCIEAIYEGNSSDRMEEYCPLDNCQSTDDLKDFHYSFVNSKEHVLTNIQEIVKIRCSNKSNDATLKSTPVDGTLLFTLTCGCKLYHGNTVVVKTERCKWYSKAVRKADISNEKIKIFQLLPSNHLKDFHGYVLSVMYLSPINSMFIIKCVVILVEIYLYFYGIRLAYLVFIALFGGRRVFYRRVYFMDLIGIYYILLRFLPYWLPGWFLREKLNILNQ